MQKLRDYINNYYKPFPIDLFENEAIINQNANQSQHLQSQTRFLSQPQQLQQEAVPLVNTYNTAFDNIQTTTEHHVTEEYNQLHEDEENTTNISSQSTNTSYTQNIPTDTTAFKQLSRPSKYSEQTQSQPQKTLETFELNSSSEKQDAHKDINNKQQQYINQQSNPQSKQYYDKLIEIEDSDEFSTTPTSVQQPLSKKNTGIKIQIVQPQQQEFQTFNNERHTHIDELSIKQKQSLYPLQCIFQNKQTISTLIKKQPELQNVQMTKYCSIKQHSYVNTTSMKQEQLLYLQQQQYLIPRNNNYEQKQRISTFKQQLANQFLHKIGIQQLRPHQEQVINQLLQNQNLLVSIATGGGKSLLYTLPALIFNKIVIVITPTIILRNNQIHELQQKNVKCHQLTNQESTSSISPRMLEIIDDACLVFVTPEKLLQEQTQQSFKQLMLKRLICLFAIDECHLMLDWQDFRDSFAKIPTIINNLLMIEQQVDFVPPVLALTATINDKSIAQIRNMFTQQQIVLEPIIFDVYRKNLFIDITPSKINKDDKQKQITELLQVKNSTNSNYTKIKILKKDVCKKTIIYCRSMKKNEQLQQQLIKQNIQCSVFHSRVKNQQHQVDQFLQNAVKVICATVAFGMGVNIVDVDQVINYDLPGSINEFLQKIGRAGRSGQDSYGVQLHNSGDILFVMKLITGDRGVDAQRKQSQIIQIIELHQFLSRRCCVWAQLQQYYCGFNIARCQTACCYCQNKPQLSLINCSEIIESLLQLITVQRELKYQNIGKCIQDELKQDFNNLHNDEIINLKLNFGDGWMEKLGIYIVNELILSGYLNIDQYACVSIKDRKQFQQNGWLVI